VARIFSRYAAVLFLVHLFRDHCRTRCGEAVDTVGHRAVPLGVAWYRCRDVFGWESASYDPPAGIQPRDFWHTGGHRCALFTVKDATMKPTLQIVDVIATRGHKATGFLEVPGTDVRMPLTLVNGVNEGASLLMLPVPLLVLDSFVVGVRTEYNLPRLQ